MALKAFLQFGGAAVGAPSGPFQTVETEAKETERPRHGQTVSGYGAKLPTPYMVKHADRWRRVYAACYGNAASHYIGKPGEWLATVDIHKESN